MARPGRQQSALLGRCPKRHTHLPAPTLSSPPGLSASVAHGHPSPAHSTCPPLYPLSPVPASMPARPLHLRRQDWIPAPLPRGGTGVPQGLRLSDPRAAASLPVCISGCLKVHPLPRAPGGRGRCSQVSQKERDCVLPSAGLLGREDGGDGEQARCGQNKKPSGAEADHAPCSPPVNT